MRIATDSVVAGRSGGALKKDRRRYAHDCTECTYLGPVTAPWANRPGMPMKRMDLYVCRSASSPDLDAIIARFGGDPKDYYSCHPNAPATMNAHLAAGMALYRARKFWKEKEEEAACRPTK